MGSEFVSALPCAQATMTLQAMPKAPIRVRRESVENAVIVGPLGGGRRGGIESALYRYRNGRRFGKYSRRDRVDAAARKITES
jgi:hypothetical protein